MTSKDLLYVEKANLSKTCTPDEFSIDNDIRTEDLIEPIVINIHRLSGKDPYKYNTRPFNSHLIVLYFLAKFNLKSF